MKKIAWLVLLPMLLLCMILSGCAGAQRMKMGGASMLPALANGDRVTVDRSAYASAAPARGDIVAFQDESGAVTVKRVIGLPGETVEIRDKKVYIDGAGLQEDYLYEQDSTEAEEGFSCAVPEKNVFVLGDNRANSKDSRDFGCVPFERILGKVAK